MSKTVKQERTKGYITRVEHQRKDRKLARDLKALLENELINTELSINTVTI